MKLILRKLALAATIMAAGAMTAQDISVTQNWIKQGLPGANGSVRSGNAVNGKCYLPDGNDLYAMDENGYTKVYTASFSINKGIAVDDAGNFIMPEWKAGGSNWQNLHLVKADFSSVQNITLQKPNSTWQGGRTDNIGVAIGDFFSEEGGLFFMTANTEKYPIPVWFKNGQQYVTEATSATFAAANSMATAMPSVGTMAQIDPDNVQNQFYYRTGSQRSQIGYVNEDGEAAYLKVPSSGMPSGWVEQSQNGFAVFTLAGQRYQIRMAGAGTWGSWCNTWVMSDDAGKVVYSQNYTGAYASTGKTGNGCNLIARQINPYKVELYQIYTTNTAAKGFCAMYTIEVPYIELDKSELDLLVGEEADLTASLGISSMTDKSVTWSSSNPEVATVDAAGHVKAVGDGTATITAKSNGNGLTATCEVTVRLDNAVSALTLDKTELSFFPGEFDTLSVTFTPEEPDDKTITWSSSNPDVATVDAQGKVTAVAPGEATITVTAVNGVSASCAVTVNPFIEVSSIVMTPDAVNISRGQTLTISASVLPENATEPAITWSTADNNIVTVNQSGLITAINPGVTTITVTATNGVTGTCTVTVTPPELDEVSAQVVITQNWIKQGLPGGSAIVRSGSALNGKFYLPGAKELYLMDENGYTKVLDTSFEMNKGLALDEKGNIVVAKWSTSASNWNKCYLISADFQNVTEITLTKPTNGDWTPGRYDILGNALGDFMSEEGGLYFMTSNAAANPIPVWIKEGQPVQLENVTEAKFATASSTASAMPSVGTMAEIDPNNVQNQFYYRNPSSFKIGYVDAEGNADYLTAPSGLPSGWAQRNQNGFAAFNLGDLRCQIFMAGPTAWTNDWVLSNAEGGIIHAQNFTDEYEATGDLYYGCNMIARQINPYKVELYQIYATTDPDKGFCSMYTVELPHILLDKAEMDLTVGETSALTAQLGTMQMADKTITWASSDPEVATVDEEGNVTAVGAGTATITATSNGNGLSASCEVTVTQEVTSISLNKDETEIIEGETETLEATVLPEDASFKTVTWSSADPEIATVDEEGVVTAIEAGATTITATASNGMTATCSVTVKQKPTGVEAITLGDEVAVLGGDIVAAPGVKVTVYDVAGRIVATTTGGKISGLARGVYLVSVPGKAPLKIEL